MNDTKKVTLVDVLTEEFAARWEEDLKGLPIELMIIREDSPISYREAIHDASIIITRSVRVDNALLDLAGERLKLVIKLSHWATDVDTELCEKRGIRVETIPQLGCISVAEHAMSLILASARKIIPAHQGVIDGVYRKTGLEPALTTERSYTFKWVPVEPFEIYGKTLGIIGFGEIGKELAIRARSFGMRVLYYKRSRLNHQVESLFEARYSSLNEILTDSDFVSLHAPHTGETDKLIDKNSLRRMKNSAYLINTARGGEIDEKALVWALETGNIAGAALDVFAEEPLPFDHPFLHFENVVLTPHIGGGTATGRSVVARRARTLITDTN